MSVRDPAAATLEQSLRLFLLAVHFFQTSLSKLVSSSVQLAMLTCGSIVSAFRMHIRPDDGNRDHGLGLKVAVLVGCVLLLRSSGS